MEEWITTSTILHDLRDFGNASAWNRFVARFRPPLLTFAERAGLSASDAQDLAQEALAAFADSFRGGNYDRDKGRLGSWLFGIAYNHILRRRRRFQRDQGATKANTDTTFWAGVPDEQSATALWEREWEASLVRQCVEHARNEFPPLTFGAFELVVLGDRPPRIAAKEMNLPVKTVYDAKYRVLQRVRELRAQLEEVES